MSALTHVLISSVLIILEALMLTPLSTAKISLNCPAIRETSTYLFFLPAFRNGKTRRRQRALESPRRATRVPFYGRFPLL